MDTKSICLLLLICVALVTSSPVTKAGKKEKTLVCVEEECNQQCIDQGHFGGYCEDGKCLCHFKKEKTLVCVEEECNQQCIDQGHFGGYCEDGKCLCHFKEDTDKVPAKPGYSIEFSQLCSTMCKKKRCSSGVSEDKGCTCNGCP